MDLQDLSQEFARTMPLGELIQRCTAETERFFQRAGNHDNQYCFELWRRALAEQNDMAWAEIYQRYQSLVLGWIAAHPQFAATEEESGYFLNAVFAAMWKSCPPERFTHFPNLPATLAYLKSCVHTTIANHLRKRRVAYVAIVDDVTPGTHDPLATVVLDQSARTELWQLLNSLLHSEKEQLVMDLFFIQGMKPRAIYAQYEEQFTSVQEVYRVKQNLMERLSRNVELHQFYTTLRENG